MIAPFKKLFLIFLASVLLAACDPEFRSASSQCSVASGGRSTIPLAGDADTPVTDLFRTPAQTTSDSYKLYLEDILEAMQAGDGVTLTTEEEEALATFISFINDEDKLNLSYEIVDGEVISAGNALDYLESVSASTDPDVQNGLFQQARELVAQAIRDNDDICNVNLLDVSFILDENEVEDTDTLSQWVFDPFIPRVDQVMAISQQFEDPDDASQLLSVPFIGSKFTDPSNFVTAGFSVPQVRQMRVNTADRVFNLLADDDFDNRTAFIELGAINVFCGTDADDDGVIEEDEREVCPMGTTTRVPAKTQCADPDGTDETGQVEVNSIDLNSTRTGYKRLRIETDYETNEVRIYGSTYVTAILDSDGTTVIEDPTSCEQSAVLDERIELTPDEVIIISNVPDPAFDVFTEEDDDGNEVTNEPTPIYTFTGTPIADR